MPRNLNHADDCRIVEYATREEAQRAISRLSNTSFMGRQIFVREVLHSFTQGELTARTVNRNPDMVEAVNVEDTIRTVGIPVAADMGDIWGELPEVRAIPPVVKSMLEMYTLSVYFC